MSSPISPPAKAASQETPARTPSRAPRRAISAEPYSARASVHTPLDRTGTRDLRASLRRGTPASAGRSNAPTPHAKAARRLLDQRRTAMFTPGKNRRQSMMQQRETPLDVLRNLGRALAPKSQPIHYSSSSSPSGNKPSSSPEHQEQSNLYADDDDDDDDDDDEFLTRRPRLSLPMDDEDASSMSSEIPPPRLSQLDEDNFTVQSIELPRRVDPQLSRGSPGSERMSDYLNNEPTDDIGQHSDFFPGFLENLEAGTGEHDMTLEAFDADQTRRMTEGRGSDFNLDIPEGLDEQTVFQMSDPANDIQQTSPIVDQSVTEARGDEVQAPQQDVMFDSDSDRGAAEFGMDGWDYNDGGVDDHSSIDEEQEPTLEPTVTATVRNMPADDRLPRGLKANKKRKRISQHGIEYPSLPPAFVKRVAQTALQSSGLTNQRLSAETLDALIQSSEWFFEQLGDDLGAYADHAKRKTIEESDVFTLMKRQRQIGPRSSMFSLAQKHLPRELLQELRMPVPQPIKQRKAKRVSDQGDEREVAEYT